MKFKTKSEELNAILPKLMDLLLERRNYSLKEIDEFNRLGIKAIKGKKHIKLYIKNKMITLSLTPSDKNAGRQALREIRRIYERN